MNFHGYTSEGKMDKYKFILFGKIGICIEIESDFFNIILISSFLTLNRFLKHKTWMDLS